MKRFFTISQLSILASIFLSSCLGSKFLKENEQLLAENEITGVSGSLKDESSALIQQTPNTRPLGILAGSPLKFMVIPFTHLAHFYQMGQNGFLFLDGYDPQKIEAEKLEIRDKYQAKMEKASKDKKKQKIQAKMIKKLDKKDREIKEGNQLMRWGEPLAVYDHNLALASKQNIKLFLNSKGYFNSSVTVDTSVIDHKKRTLHTQYNVNLGTHYIVDSIEYIIEDTVLKELVLENLLRAPLKKGYYDQETLTRERDYIYNLAVNNGYYEFTKQYISFEIDSTMLGKEKLFVREIIKNPVNRDQHKIFYLDSIVFISDASVTRSYERTIEKYKDLTFNFGKNRYSKKILQWRIPLEQDDRYSRDLTIETQRQLSYLDNFKFVNINYDTTNNHFVANIFTSPLDKYQTSNEFGLTVNSGNSGANRPGPFFNLSLINRNTFRALEIISINLNAKLEGISGVTAEQSDVSYSSIQYGGQLAFTFPQFLFPLGRYYKKKMGRFNPKTRLSLGLTYENRLEEYTRRAIQSSFAFTWQIRDQIKHTLSPIQTSVIQSDNSTAFENFLAGLDSAGNTYANAFRSAFVSSTAYQFDLSLGEYNKGRDGGFVHFFVETGGNLNNIFGENAFGDSIETYQFIKTNIDLRKIEKVTRKLNIAYRLNIGVALAYGDNNSLPYEKYFFGGGASSLRAWRPRRLGPGAFGVLNNNEVVYNIEQPGDIVIESSFEFRQKLVGFLEGSLFFDAGNIWLLRGSTVDPNDDPEGDDGKFRWDSFMKEMAMGTGVGFRFDLSFLVLRLDLGFKLFDPAQPPGNRFVGGQIFSNFGTNSEFNIGIGYPF